MEPEESAALAQVRHRLRRRFPQVAVEEIDRVLEGVHRTYEGRPIRQFVPILVEREVTEILHAASQATTTPRREEHRSALEHLAR